MLESYAGPEQKHVILDALDGRKIAGNGPALLLYGIRHP